MCFRFFVLFAMTVTALSSGCNQKGSAMKKRNLEALSKANSESGGSGGSIVSLGTCESWASSSPLEKVNLEGKTIAFFDEDSPVGDDGSQAIKSCVDYSELNGNCRFKKKYDSTWTNANCANNFRPYYFGIYCVGTEQNKYIDPACNNNYWKDGCQVIGNHYIKNRSMKFDGTSISYTDDGKTYILAKIVPKGTCEPVNPWRD